MSKLMHPLQYPALCAAECYNVMSSDAGTTYDTVLHSDLAYHLRQGDYVFGSVGLSVSNITQKVMGGL